MCRICQSEGVLLGQIETVTLENREDNHNKQYTLWIEDTGSGFRVMARYGPIGGWSKAVVKSVLYSSVSQARSVLIETRDSKTARGYVRRICVEREEATHGKA